MRTVLIRFLLPCAEYSSGHSIMERHRNSFLQQVVHAIIETFVTLRNVLPQECTCAQMLARARMWKLPHAYWTVLPDTRERAGTFATGSLSHEMPALIHQSCHNVFLRASSRRPAAKFFVRCQSGTARFRSIMTNAGQLDYFRFLQQGLERLERWLLDFWVVLGEKLKNYTQRLKGRVEPRIVVDPRNIQQPFEVTPISKRSCSESQAFLAGTPPCSDLRSCLALNARAKGQVTVFLRIQCELGIAAQRFPCLQCGVRQAGDLCTL